MGGSLRSLASLTQGSVVIPAAAAVNILCLEPGICLGGGNSHL